MWLRIPFSPFIVVKANISLMAHALGLIRGCGNAYGTVGPCKRSLWHGNYPPLVELCRGSVFGLLIGDTKTALEIAVEPASVM